MFTYSRSSFCNLAILVLACGQSMVCAAAAPQKPEVLAPACKNPAPLQGEWSPNAAGYFAIFKDGVDGPKATVSLVKKHGFAVEGDLSMAGMFLVRVLTPRQMAALRCEPQIRLIEYNGMASASGK